MKHIMKPPEAWLFPDPLQLYKLQRTENSCPCRACAHRRRYTREVQSSRPMSWLSHEVHAIAGSPVGRPLLDVLAALAFGARP